MKHFRAIIGVCDGQNADRENGPIIAEWTAEHLEPGKVKWFLNEAFTYMNDTYNPNAFIDISADGMPVCSYWFKTASYESWNSWIDAHVYLILPGREPVFVRNMNIAC